MLVTSSSMARVLHKLLLPVPLHTRRFVYIGWNLFTTLQSRNLLTGQLHHGFQMTELAYRSRHLKVRMVGQGKTAYTALQGRKFIQMKNSISRYNCSNVFTLCPKSPIVRGLDTSLPVSLLFKSIKYNAFLPCFLNWVYLSHCGNDETG